MEEGLSDPSRRKTEKVTRPRWVVRTPLKGWRSTFEGRGKERRDWNGSGATNAFEIFKGTVRGEERKGRVRVPLFCLVRGCSRETRITHELALSQFYTRHVPSKRVVKSTSPPRLLSLPTLCVHSHLSRPRLRFNPDQTQTLRVTLLVELSIPRIEQSSSTLLRPYGPIYLHHPPFSTLGTKIYFTLLIDGRCSLRILTYDIEYNTYLHEIRKAREKRANNRTKRNETENRGKCTRQSMRSRRR